MRYDMKTEITLFDADIDSLKQNGVIKAGNVLVFYREGEQQKPKGKRKK